MSEPRPPDPTGNPFPPRNPPVPCVEAPVTKPPPVSDDPVVAQKQARVWREDVIRLESVIAKLTAKA
jgi:hypothetical protein